MIHGGDSQGYKSSVGKAPPTHTLPETGLAFGGHGLREKALHFPEISTNLKMRQESLIIPSHIKPQGFWGTAFPIVM